MLSQIMDNNGWKTPYYVGLKVKNLVLNCFFSLHILFLVKLCVFFLPMVFHLLGNSWYHFALVSLIQLQVSKQRHECVWPYDTELFRIDWLLMNMKNMLTSDLDGRDLTETSGYRDIFLLLCWYKSRRPSAPAIKRQVVDVDLTLRRWSSHCDWSLVSTTSCVPMHILIKKISTWKCLLSAKISSTFFSNWMRAYFYHTWL